MIGLTLNRLRPLTIGMLATMLLAACTVGPNYRRPDVEIPSAWRLETAELTDISNLPAERRNCAMMFQSYALWPHMTVSQNIAYAFKAACYFMPLIGGLIADRDLGKYWTIVAFAVPYVAGPILLGIPIEWVYYLGLGILVIGTGVIKPNISTLMGMTYDQKRPGDTQLRTDAFFMFYFAINLGSTFSYTLLPILTGSTHRCTPLRIA